MGNDIKIYGLIYKCMYWYTNIRIARNIRIDIKIDGLIQTSIDL